MSDTINPKTYEAYQLLHKGTLALARAERQGIHVDVDYIESKQKELTEKIDQLETEFKSSRFYLHWEHVRKGKVDIYSPTQLRHFLYDVKKYEAPKRTEKGSESTDNETLLSFGEPALNILCRAKQYKQTRDTFLKSFLNEEVRGIMHPFYNLNLAKSFRSSSNSPNFQNIPKRDEEIMSIVRGAIIPRPGHILMEVDFSGMEVRVSCCYNKDPNLIRDVTNPAFDMHRDLAIQIFKLDKFDKDIDPYKTLRQAAKNGFVFPQFYGSYYKNCSPNLACTWGKMSRGKWEHGEGIQMEKGTLSDHLISKGIKSLDDFTEHLRGIEKYFWEERFPDYAEWKERWWNVYKKYGYFDLYTGFRCNGVMYKEQVTNLPIQGSAFHCLLWSFIRVDEVMQEERWDTRLIGQIHDSMVFDAHPDEIDHVINTVHRITSEELPNAWKWIIVPMEVEVERCPVDGSWATKKKSKN